MQFETVDLPVLYFGTPVALVSSLNPDGTTNLSPISSYWALGRTLVIGVGKAGRCFRNLERGGGVVVNLPDASLWRKVEAIAATTGVPIVPDHKIKMGYRHEADKFGAGGFTALASDMVQPARVADCPIQIEAEVVQCISIGNGEIEGMAAIELRVLKVHAEHGVLQKGTGRVDVENWKPLHYVFRHYFTLGEKLGSNFRAS